MSKIPTILIALFVLSILVGLLFWGFERNIENASMIPPDGLISVAGIIECLPHKDTSGPQTMECAFGLEGDDGNHYALADSETPGLVAGIPTGTRVVVVGDFRAEESDRYASIGLITVGTVTPSGGATSHETVSDGVIKFTRISSFGLAVTDEQMLVQSAIPPCDSGFSYCFYYYGDDYAGSNFESAGLGVFSRPDLETENACLTTRPEGYSSISAHSEKHEGYSVSKFAPLGQGAAGHYTNEEEYRLFTADVCYAFRLRIAETQFSNYPEGEVIEFIKSEREGLLETLRSILSSTVIVKSGESPVLPE